MKPSVLTAIEVSFLVLHDRGLVGLNIAYRMAIGGFLMLFMDMENVSIAGELSHLEAI